MERVVKQEFRTFIAVRVPDQLKKELGKIQLDLGEQTDVLNFIKKDQLHISLAFLGRMSREAQTEVVRACEAVMPRLSRFELYPAQLGAFPRMNRPAVIHVELKGNADAFALLYTSLRQELFRRRLISEKSTGELTPHITIARVDRKKRRHHMAPLKDIIEEMHLSLPGTPIPVAEIVVYGSSLNFRGPEYFPIKTIPIGK